VEAKIILAADAAAASPSLGIFMPFPKHEITSPDTCGLQPVA